MTADREEKLIDDVAWMRGQLETYFEKVAPTLATKESVESVDARITTHIENHKESRNQWPLWVGVASSSIIAVAGVIVAFVKRGN